MVAKVFTPFPCPQAFHLFLAQRVATGGWECRDLQAQWTERLSGSSETLTHLVVSRRADGCRRAYFAARHAPVLIHHLVYLVFPSHSPRPVPISSYPLVLLDFSQTRPQLVSSPSRLSHGCSICPAWVVFFIIYARHSSASERLYHARDCKRAQQAHDIR